MIRKAFLIYKAITIFQFICRRQIKVLVMVMKVKEGDVSMKGQPLSVIEAMKMKSTINSNVEGTVKKYISN